MAEERKTRLPEILKKHEADLLAEWMQEQLASIGQAAARLSETELREQCRQFLRLLVEATQRGSTADIESEPWQEVRELLAEVSKSRGLKGFGPSDTAMFVFSFKKPLIARLGGEFSNNPGALADELWRATILLDRLGLFTTEVYQKSREELINRQQQEMMELSTPVVKLWDGILALPLIGTLDSARTQIVMESLLHRIVETEADVAIIDITGVPTVDTLVAQHLIKTVTAARLMGADCIISGIRPQIAQTIVHLGVDLAGITTKASLADAFSLALKRGNYVISRTGAAKVASSGS